LDGAVGSTAPFADPACVLGFDFEDLDPACADGLDNDADGLVDRADPGCRGSNRGRSEVNPQCSDGIDNDEDGQIDAADTACQASTPTTYGLSELAPYQCSDGIDNDAVNADGVDYNPAGTGPGLGDPQCTSATDNSETT
jgi:hypothetical protein